MLTIELRTAQIPETFRRFASEIGEEHWLNRVKLCNQEITGNVFLRELLWRENEIAFQLNHLSELTQRHRRIPMQEIENPAIYPSASLMAQALSVMDTSTKEDAERFRRRIHGALKNPADMRGLRLELSAATHFIRRGKKVSWPETTGIGTFDLLVEGDNHSPLEVECKSISEDKGRRIHRRDTADFVALLEPQLRPTTTGLRRGMSVKLTIPDKLPSVHKQRIELAKSAARAVFAGQNICLPDGTTIQITDFDLGQLGNAPHLDPRQLRAALDGISGTNNRSAVVIGTKAGGALVITIQSQREDSLLDSIFDTLGNAAKRQLTGLRAGMLFTGLDGLAGEQLSSVAAQDNDSSQPPTALTLALSQFMSSEKRDHVVGVGFMSRNALHPRKSGIVDSGGTAYYFPKRASRLWSDGFSGLFN